MVTAAASTLSAGLAAAQAQLQQAVAGGGDSAADAIARAADAYRASGGGPTLAWLGFNPFQVLAAGAFHELYWSTVIVALGISGIVALHESMIGRQTLTARHPFVTLSQVTFRLMTGVILIGNLPLLYGVVTVLGETASQAMQAMASQSAGGLLQAGNLGTLSLAQARMEAIRDAAARRALALDPQGASRDEMVQVGSWYDATATAVNAGLDAENLPGKLPLLDPAVWTDPAVPDDRVTAYVGRSVVGNFGQLVADLGALPPSCGPLSVDFPEGRTSLLPPLSAALAADDAQAAGAGSPSDSSGDPAGFESARRLYAANVRADTLTYLDTRLLAVIGASPTLAQRVKAWFSEAVERAAAAVNPLPDLRAAADTAARCVGIVLTRMIAFLYAAAVRVLIEIDLFLLVLAVPLWLLPATEDAFYGVARSLFSLALAVPAYQFVMLFVDALMALVLRYLLFGPLATPSSGPVQTAAGAATMAAAALAVVGSGGEILALAIFCYLVAYAFLAVYAARKTPKLVALFLKGGAVAGAAVSSFATGLIGGAATALATAAVAGGGGLAGGLLSWRPTTAGGAPGSPAPAYAARTPVGAAGAPPIPRVPPLQPLPARTGPAPTRPGGRFAEAAGFGLRTFADALSADTPAEGMKTAIQAWDRHRKQKEKEEEARAKALKAAKR